MDGKLKDAVNSHDRVGNRMKHFDKPVYKNDVI